MNRTDQAPLEALALSADAAAASAEQAKLATPTKPTKASKKTPVRLLTDCQHGRANDLVELDADDLDACEASGVADSDKGAVAYAKSLPQNQTPA